MYIVYYYVKSVITDPCLKPVISTEQFTKLPLQNTFSSPFFIVDAKFLYFGLSGSLNSGSNSWSRVTKPILVITKSAKEPFYIISN